MKRGDILERYSGHLRRNDYSPRTLKCYLAHVNLYLDYADTQKKPFTDKALLSSYTSYLEKVKQISYPCRKQFIAAITILYRDVLKLNVPVHTSAGLKKNRVLPVILSKSEIKKIIDSIGNLKHKTIIATIYSCGLRVSEACNLRLADIDFAGKNINIIDEKKGTSRSVMLSVGLSRLFLKYIEKYKPNIYLIEGKNGGRYSTRSIQEIFNKALKTAGISKKVTAGTLRHSFAVHLLDNGTDIRIIQELLGHKHLSTTLIYTYINPPSARKIKNPFDLIVLKNLSLIGLGL